MTTRSPAMMTVRTRPESWAAVVVMVAGAMVLVGWVFDIAALKSVLPGRVAMKANTAVGFILTGIALLLVARPPTSRPRLTIFISLFARLCCLLAGLIGLVSLGEYVFDWNLDIDQWLFREPVGAVGTSHLGRMAPEAALCFVLLAAALWIAGGSRQTRWTVLASASLGLLVTALALTATLSYATPGFGPYGWFGLTIMAMHTSLLFALLGTTVIAINWRQDVLPWLLGRYSTAAFACGMALLVLIGFNTNRSQFWLAEVGRKLAFSEEVRGDIKSIMFATISAQSYTRGYVITGDEHFKTHYLEAKAESNVKLDALRKLIAGDPHQHQQIARIEEQVKTQLQWFQQVIDARSAGMTDATRNNMIRHGEDLLDNFNITFDQIESEHRQSIGELNQEAESVSRLSYLILSTGTLASLLIFLTVIFRLNFAVNERMQMALALAEKDTFLRTLVNAIPDPIWLKDKEGIYQGCNPMFERLFDAKEADIVGKTDYDFVDKELADSFREHDRIAMAAGKPVINEEWVSFADDGHRALLETIKAPMHDAEGKLVGVLGIARDITERKHAEQIVIDERIFSDSLIASQPDVFYVLDQTGRFIRWNGRLRDVLGYSDSQLAITDALAVIHEADRPSFAQKIQEAFEQGAVTIEARLVTKMGIRDYRFNATSADTAKGAYLIGVGTDITERKHAEQTLRDSENRYRNIVETTSDWVWEVDENAVYTYASPKAHAITGYQPAELIGTTPFDLMAPEEAKRVASLFAPLAAAHQPMINLENTRLHKDGHPIVFESSGVPVIDADGKLCGYRGIDRDITERKQAQVELRESELAYRTLSQNLPGMVYRVFVREGGRMQFYNEMPVLMTGYTVDELTTGTVCSIEPLILNDDRPGVMVEVKRAIAGKCAFAVEYRLKHKDGGIRWMAEHGMPVYGTDGAPLYIDGVIFDITEHKQDEIKLKLFRTLLDNSRDAIEVVDPATMRFLDVNETECRELGYSREELLSMKISDVDTTFTPNQMKELKAQILQTGEGRIERMHRRKDNTTYPVEVRAKIVEIGKPYMLSIVRDITERKLAEGEVQKLQEQLREQALHDPLTGLYNRRYLDVAMGRELIRAERNKQPIGIVMCDIDNFKVVNDTYGHLVGDEVLRVFAGLLRKNSRGSDIICRFGGEEFLMFLPDMPPDVAYQRAELLRTAIAAKRITSGVAVIQVTASFGVAAFPENGKTQDALIRAVDAAMYQAKETGRNRVVVASAHEEEVPDPTEMGSAEVSRRKDKRRADGH